jgi:hypothetical protein
LFWPTKVSIEGIWKEDPATRLFIITHALISGQGMVISELLKLDFFVFKKQVRRYQQSQNCGRVTMSTTNRVIFCLSYYHKSILNVLYYWKIGSLKIT